MIPVFALVGRPNVGKSTLFNALTRTRDALVADEAGLTRDRQYGRGRTGDCAYWVVDTGGLSSDSGELAALISEQADVAMQDSDLVLWMLDARDGITAEDREILARLRRNERPIVLVINKVDGLNEDLAVTEFYELGLGEPIPIAASHRRGVHDLIDICFEQLPGFNQDEAESTDQPELEQTTRVTIVGRPNVGKSTLVNRLLGEERVLALDMPGTTRDSVEIPLQWDEQDYVFVDTAGIRRRAKVHDGIEKFSVIKALQAMEASQVVVVMLDAQQGIVDQDATLLGLVLQTGKALVLAINKWDGVKGEPRKEVLSELKRKLGFVEFAEQIRISALHGSGLRDLMQAVDRAHTSAMRPLQTHMLSELLAAATAAHQPPMKQGRATRLRYAHAGGVNPPRIIIHGNRTSFLTEAYKRYLASFFRKALKIVGSQVRLQFRDGKNPFEGKKNLLSERQINKKRRLKQFSSKR